MRVLVCSSIAPQPLIMMMKMSMLSYICSLEVLHYLDVWSSPFCIAFFPTKLVTQIFVRRVFGVVYKLRTEYMPPANREPVSCFHRVSIQKQNPARYGFSFLLESTAVGAFFSRSTNLYPFRWLLRRHGKQTMKHPTDFHEQGFRQSGMLLWRNLTFWGSY